MIYDLHTHSNASDGLLSPAALLDLAVHSGLAGIALTDHDTLEGLPDARAYHEQQELNLVFIPGVELNTEYQGNEVHILGYGIKEDHPVLCGRLAELKQLRRDRARRMVERLQGLGLAISMREVEAKARGDQIGRPHIAMVLVDKGYTSSLAQGFKIYLNRGRPAYVPRYPFEPSEAIAMIKEASGISVLAHPGLIRRQEVLKDIIGMGVQGLECYYPQHSKREIEQYRRLAQDCDLAVTGGSDFHGSGSGEKRDIIGGAGLSVEEFQAFLGKI